MRLNTSILLLFCVFYFTSVSPSAEIEKTQRSEFYNNYLAKYYPRAYIIRNNFWNGATPEAVAEELVEVVKILTDEPWFYVSDKPAGFNVGHYWEFIVDQCSIINEFLRHAYIDQKTQKVFLLQVSFNDYNFDFDYSNLGLNKIKKQQNESLLVYWKRSGQHVHNDFYALCFDYLIKLFNEGILLKNLKQAQRYYRELENILAKLRGSDYEIDYQNSLKTCMELMTKLQHLVGYNPQDYDKFDENNDFGESCAAENFSSSELLCAYDDIEVSAQKVDKSKSSFTADFACEFIESFVKHYEFNPEGRYTHEYHPALLSKTAESFDILEKQLSQAGFDLSGRVVIMGYEENAVPCYYTNYKKSRINDEASLKVKAGWSLRLSNRFGFMSGFLFKEFNEIGKKLVSCFDTPIARPECFARQNVSKDAIGTQHERVFLHVNSDLVPIFNSRADIFQEHAFGDALPLIWATQETVSNHFIHQDFKSIFQELINFWTRLYSRGFKIGNNQVAGTQDVLFSIEYARHLMNSALPVFKFFVGPDITYPIEISNKQDKDVTVHAQKFIKILARELKPVKDEETVYIFCSFVDGVGKSTMLGNIKNWMKFGDDVNNFNHVDNSSSQLAELFTFKDKVFIADMPAQISHFTYKPDGVVYVDAKTELTLEQIKNLQKHVEEHAEDYKENYYKMLDALNAKLTKDGAQSIYLNKNQSMGECFIANVLLLKKQKTNSWVPFELDGKNYLFDFKQSSQIRYLIPLGQVKSEGLKNIESEQMLFFDGIRFPYMYQYFLNDLISRLQAQKVKHVVFVDFTSMYPRSSRENIRINYLVQQMALLNSSFSPNASLYKEFVSGGELLSCLLDKTTAVKIFQSFNLEALLRFALLKLVVDRAEGDLTGIPVQSLTQRIKQILATNGPSVERMAHDAIVKKVKKEANKLRDVYGLSKPFVNVQQTTFNGLCAFSGLLSELFSRSVSNESLNYLWEDPGLIVGVDDLNENGAFNNFVENSDNVSFYASYAFDPECKEAYLLAPLMRMLRANWYAAICNLFYLKNGSIDSLALDFEKYFVAPIFVKQGLDNNIYSIQKVFEEWEAPVPPSLKSLLGRFNLSSWSKKCFVNYNNNPYRFDWNSVETKQGIYAFDCTYSEKNNQKNYGSIINSLVQEARRDKSSDVVVTTSELYSRLQKSTWWSYESRRLLGQAKKNGPFKVKNDATPEAKIQKRSQNVHLGTMEIKPAVKLMIRLMATLEMVLKDPDGNIALRLGSKKDFAAALKLYELVLLPHYFGVMFETQLFEDYERVEPYPSWEHWEQSGIAAW